MSRLTYIDEGENPFKCQLECDQCDHVTLNGLRCQRRVCIGVPTCWQHTKTKYGVKSAISTIVGAGKGLFATRNFNRWEWICPYIGENITDACLTARFGNGTAPYATDSVGGAIDSACRRGIASLANGLFTANGNSRGERFHNARIVYNPDGEIWVRAIKFIPSGDEIYIFYGKEYRLDGLHSTKRVRAADSRPC